jgi:hypothetical protein
VAAGIAAGQPAAKPTTCATCHASEARSQPHTAMGIGMEVGADQPLLKAHPKLTFEKNGYTYVIERKNDVSTYTVGDGTDTLTLPIRYAFGIRMQTFVLEREGRFYESLVSYYPSIGGLTITMGSERIRPHSLVEAMGREISNDEAARCFGCHSSGGVSDGQLHLEALRPGLDCEHCHTGAQAHLEALAQGKPGPVPQKLGKLSAEEMSGYCGNCHRSWETVVRNRWWGEVNVRFQPYRLANSKCFLGDDRRIACTSCHDPHKDLVRDEAGYDRNCLACHIAGSQPQTAAKTCPVGKDKCASCHMQKIELPGSHSIFTDHDIRIVHPGDAYPN